MFSVLRIHMNGRVYDATLARFLSSDPHIQEAQAKMDYLKSVVETLEEIINTLRWRHSTIKNMIDWRRFESGG